MATATLRFYEELNDFLPADRRKRQFPARFREGDTVKALVESLGVPHTEVDLILINGCSASFDQQVQDGDRISVYPVFESLEIASVTKVRPTPLRRPRFVLDVHLGRLAKLLRMLGFDSLYSNTYDDQSLCCISRDDRRIILTRDRELLKRSMITHGYCLRSDQPMEQLVEVLKRFDLGEKIRPFSRCLRCNCSLHKIDSIGAFSTVPEYVARTYDCFKTCPDCGRVYWRGSHWDRMRKVLDTSL